MKRSQINEALRWAKDLLEKTNIRLPEWAYWSLDEWKQNKDKIDTIEKVMLGWDITDYAEGDFLKLGTVLFTLRNGDQKDSSIGVPYAEKLIILHEGQSLPCHFHYSKTEDIITRAAGVMGIELYKATDDYEIDKKSDVTVYMDGVKTVIGPGEKILVKPGSSITLTPYMYHRFWAEPGYGDVVIGEVSAVNDDNVDNHFNPPLNRFSTVEEDEAILHPLCNEYGKVL